MKQKAPTQQPVIEEGDPRTKAAEVLRRLEKEQGRVTWHPRYDPVSELVFTILSQHVSDVNSEQAYHRLREAYPTWEAVAQADVPHIRELIRTAGLEQAKAPRIKNALNLIIEKRGKLELDFLADMPLEEAKAWLRAIPGVGPKTAAIVLCFALGMPAMPVDTHVYRVAQRLRLIGPKVSYEKSHDVMESLVSSEDIYRFHVHLITHGRRVCKAPWPFCERCVLADMCPSRSLFLVRPKRAKIG